MSLRALGGGELVGEKFVRFVYVDETGMSSKEHEPHAVVVGVIVHADTQLIALKKALDALVIKHIPVEFRDGFVFHAKDIFMGSGKGYFNRKSERWPMPDKRWAIADDLSALLAEHKLPIAYGSVERSKIPADLLESASVLKWNETLIGHGLAFTRCAFRIAHWMRVNASDEVCMLIVEDSESARTMIRETQSNLQRPGIETTFSDMPHALKVLPLTSIQHEPLFENKRPSSVLQLADYCAYIVKRTIRGDPKILRFVNPIRHLVIDGPVE